MEIIEQIGWENYNQKLSNKIVSLIFYSVDKKTNIIT